MKINQDTSVDDISIFLGKDVKITFNIFFDETRISEDGCTESINIRFLKEIPEEIEQQTMLATFIALNTMIKSFLIKNGRIISKDGQLFDENKNRPVISIEINEIIEINEKD